jgi:hypothetical protein
LPASPWQAAGYSPQSRRDKFRLREWEIHLALVEAGQRILDNIAAGKPKRTSSSDGARVLDLASRLGRLATGMATENTQVNSPDPPTAKPTNHLQTFESEAPILV